MRSISFFCQEVNMAEAWKVKVGGLAHPLSHRPVIFVSEATNADDFDDRKYHRTQILVEIGSTQGFMTQADFAKVVEEWLAHAPKDPSDPRHALVAQLVTAATAPPPEVIPDHGEHPQS